MKKMTASGAPSMGSFPKYMGNMAGATKVKKGSLKGAAASAPGVSSMSMGMKKVGKGKK